MTDKEIIALAVKAGIEAFERAREEHAEGLVDRRRANVKLLLRNYRAFKAHAENAVFESEQSTETPLEILESMMTGRESVTVESIKRSAARTATIVKHIDAMLDIYRVVCAQSSSETASRKMDVIERVYLAEKPTNVKDIAAEYGVVPQVIYDDINDAADALGALMFGIDGIGRGKPKKRRRSDGEAGETC